jgi:ankyrin repeat protein
LEMPLNLNSLRRAVAALFLLAPGLAAPANIDDDWLEALTTRDLAVIERLLPKRTDVNVAAKDGRTALMLAAGQARADLVRDLLTAGAEINAVNTRGGTALMYSAVTGDAPTVHTLLARGAAINARATNGWTAVMIAAVNGHTHLVRDLLYAGADPNISDIYGWTPLMRATNENRDAVVRELLKIKETDVDAKDEHGDTALHHAAVKGHVEIARALLARGAKVQSVNVDGRTPLMIASAQGYAQLAKILRSASK